MDDKTALALLYPYIGPVSLSLPDNLPWGDWLRIGEKVRQIALWSPWAVGDWWNAGDRLYGAEASQAIGERDLDLHTIQNYSWVCARFPVNRRREKVPFSLHAEVAAFPPELADGWLALAEAEGWRREQLRAAIREARRKQVEEEMGDVIELPPAVKGRGIVEVNGGLAYVGLTALGDLLASLEGYEIEFTARPLGPAAEEA